MEHKLICIACPMGCHLTVSEDKDAPEGWRVEGNTCKRGAAYGIKEITCPSRTLTSTVKICDGTLCRLPVVTAGEIPKERLFDAMTELNHIEVKAPVRKGDVILSNIAGTGVALVASRSISHI